VRQGESALNEEEFEPLRRDGVREDLPWVYVSEGTVHLDPQLLRAAAQGLSNLPIEVIMTTGRHRELGSLNLGPRPLGRNIHVYPWLDIGSLLKKVSSVVNVGGPGTIMAALNSAVPVVIVPFAWDHPETGWRIRASGAGVLVEPKHLSPETLRVAVMQTLNDPAIREKARVVADSFRALGGARTAARFVHELKPERGTFPKRKGTSW
jgi:UDP:flavonoid glycosyltransferase YjiC (YdhE family)